MEYSWDIHEIFMGYSWDIHGIFMGYSWDIHGIWMSIGAYCQQIFGCVPEYGISLQFLWPVE